MKLPSELVAQIAKGNGVLFVGSGLSQEAGLPGWPDLLRQMLDWAQRHSIAIPDREEIEIYIDHSKLLLVAEEMRERLGKERFCRFMIEVFNKPNQKPTETHKLLTAIPFAAVLTSNYDHLLETAYTLERGTAQLTFTQLETPELVVAQREGRFYILKGTLKNNFRFSKERSVW